MKTEYGLFDVLEKHLRRARKPLTCVDLYKIPEVQQYAVSANRVSDYLGNMWRTYGGRVLRLPAPQTAEGAARFAYSWNHDAKAPPEPVKRPIRHVKAPGRPLHTDTELVVTQDGDDIVIATPTATVRIHPLPHG